MAPFGSGHTVLDGNSTPDSPKGATMPRNGVMLAILAAVLVAAGCADDKDGSPADPVENADLDSAASAADPSDDANPAAPVASESEPSENTVAYTESVRLNERFAWCRRVQALWDGQDEARAETEAAWVAYQSAVEVLSAATDDLDRAEAQEGADDALAAYDRATADYAAIRWRAAGLIFSDEAVFLGGGVEDTTLQVALERAFEAYRAGAASHTLASFGLAHDATDTATRLHAAAYSDSDESTQVVEATESDAAPSEAAPLDASEAWLRATEAFEDILEAAEDAEDAQKATSAAAAAARVAVTEARDAARAIYRSAAQADGGWEAIATDIKAHSMAALSAVEATAGFAAEIVEAHAEAEAAAQAAKIAAQASAAARTLAEQSGATEGAQAYWDIRRESPRGRLYDAEFAASVAAATAFPADTLVAEAAKAAEEAAWRAARVSADIDAGGVAAFKDSLQESCR